MPVITTNTAANTALRYLNINSQNQSETLAHISSGSRITKASDDASGLAIGTKLQTDVATLSQAKTNVSHGQSILAVADGGLASISDILERMKSLSAQSLSGAVSDTERAYIDAEYQQLVSEIDSIVAATTFNGAELLGGAYDENFLAGSQSTDMLSVTLTGAAYTFDAAGLGLTGSLATTAAATTEITAIESAIDAISSGRANVGALMSRFEFRAAMLASSTENTDAAQSAIMDADIAAEQAELSSNKVLTQAAIAALGQANQLPEDLLDLLR